MRVLLVGHPVSHSLSPVMQNAALRELGLPHFYEAADTPPAGLRPRLSELRGADFLGANVTVPHKVAAVQAMDEVDADVGALGALNTIVSRAGRLIGFNTDVQGAWAGLLEPVRSRLDGATVLLLGAGGAARAVLMALTRCGTRGPREVVVAARRPPAAAELVTLAAGLGLACRPVAWEDRGAALLGAQVVCNCTPLGLEGDDPLSGVPLGGKVVLDLAYRRGGTALFRRAARDAPVALQGDEMLLQQGARSFELWTGREAPVAVMRAALTEAIG